MILLDTGQTVRTAFEVPCVRGVEPATAEDSWIRLKAELPTRRVSDLPEGGTPNGRVFEFRPDG